MARIFAGARIRALRQERGLTQSSLAQTLGFSTSYLNQLEHDHRPLTVTTLMRLVSVFGVSADYFSGDEAVRMAAALEQALARSLGRAADGTELRDLASRFPELAQDLLALSRMVTDDPEDLGSPSGGHRASGLPHEQVRDFFHANGNHFDEIDRAAEALADTLPAPRGERNAALRRLLKSRHGITVVGSPATPDRRGKLLPTRVYDPDRKVLALRVDLRAAQQAFQLGMQIAFLDYADLLDRALTDTVLLPGEAHDLARFGLAQYFAAALVLPYRTFLRAAQEVRYDIDLLGARFGTSFETTAHRLSTLQRQEARGVPFFLLRADRAGNISKRQSATAFHFSHRGGSCPLWVLHLAFDSPRQVVRQVASMPDGRCYLWVARALSRPTGGFGSPPTEYSIGLGCDLAEAHQLVYGDGLGLEPDQATPIGPGCRTCPRDDCLHRAFPSVGRAIAVDENRTPAVPYVYDEPAGS